MSQEASQGDVAVPMNAATRLAYERTYLAQERTQMAWIRTAVSLISFGFTISKFFEYLQSQKGEVAPLLGAQNVGVAMIAFGLVGLILATIQHRRALRALHAQCPDLPPSLSRVMAALLSFLGLMALAGTIFRG